MMIAPGMKLYSTIRCLTCGEDLRVGNEAPSAFILGSCGNMNCEAYMVSLVIERATMTIIAITPEIYVVDGKRVYPVLVDKDGAQVWPKVAKKDEIERPVPAGTSDANVV